MRRAAARSTGHPADTWRNDTPDAAWCRACGETSMKYAVGVLLIVTSAITSIAVAQDGTGHGPPKTSAIVTVPTVSTMTAGSLSSQFQPKAELSSMLK